MFNATLGSASGAKRPQPGVNPFAAALAKANPVETESGMSSSGELPDSQGEMNLGDLTQFGQALSNEAPYSQLQDNFGTQPETNKAAELQRRAALSRRLAELNPNKTAIFNQQRQKDLAEINQLRQQIFQIGAPVLETHQEIVQTVTTNVVDPGLEGGKYHKNFLKRVLSITKLAVRSAESWTEINAQKQRRQPKNGPGLPNQPRKGTAAETKFVQDTMHHEKSASFSGA